MKVLADAALFIHARAMTWPQIPLAAVRSQASGLPTEVVSGEISAMAPNRKLSSQAGVVVSVLLFSNGTANAALDDLRGDLSWSK